MFRKKWLIIAVLMFFLAPTFEAKAIDFMGPPTAELTQGQWNAGFVYSFSEMDLEFSGNGISETIKDVQTFRYCANLGYGATDKWELNLRLGAANAEVDDLDFDGSVDFAIGFNTKITFATQDDIDWGALFQISWFSTDDSYNYDLSAWGLGTSQSAEIDAYEIQFAVGPTWNREGWKLYGGPFFHIVDGDFDFDIGGATFDFDLEEDSVFGGYIGSEIDLAENAILFLEIQLTGSGYGASGGAVWTF